MAQTSRYRRFVIKLVIPEYNQSNSPKIQVELRTFFTKKACCLISVAPKRNLGNSIILFVYVLHTGVNFITLTSVIFKRSYCFRVLAI